MSGTDRFDNSAPDTPRPGLDLPVTLAFLMQHGVAGRDLAEAARRASRNRTDPVQEAFALGLLDEADYYRALAAALELPFHDEDFALQDGGDYGAILRGGIAPVVGPLTSRFRFILAPEGSALQRMLESGPRRREDIAVATPRRFAEALRAANGAVLAEHAANLDETGRERESARLGSSRGQRVATGLGVAGSAAGGVLAPLETFFALAFLLGPVFLGLILLRLAASMERPASELWRTRHWRIDDSRLPVYTVAVPLYRELAVLDQMLGALRALDYPAAKLDIRLLIEADDPAMQAALKDRHLPAHVVVSIVPPGQPRTKPRALNLALLEARGSLFTIFDAEDIPDPGQLRLAAMRFLRGPPELACLQARLVIDHASEGVLPGFFALEYSGLFEVINPGLLRAGLPIMLGGTSNHFRTEILRAVGGWDAWNVTEDADLGFRLVRAGFGIGDLPSNTREEAPMSLKAWLRQRSRWIKGYMQTLVTHSRRPLAFLREAGPAATFAFWTLVLGTVATALGYPLFAVVTVIAWWQGSLFDAPDHFTSIVTAIAVTVWMFGAIALVLPPAIGAFRRRSLRLLMYVPFLPLYYGLISIAAWMALYEYRTSRFNWNKTMHGLARRRAPPAETRLPKDAEAIPPPPRRAGARY